VHQQPVISNSRKSATGHFLHFGLLHEVFYLALSVMELQLALSVGNISFRDVCAVCYISVLVPNIAGKC
jgi:hypothetical protein